MGVAAVEAADGKSHAVVKEHSVDALQPFGALIDERLAQPHQGPELEDVLRRNPRFGQPPLDEQVTQVTGIPPIGLRSALGSSPRAGLSWLGQVHHRTDAL